MDDRHVIYNTTVIGLMFVVVCWITIFVCRPDQAVAVLEWLDEGWVSHTKGASEALARWIAIGVSVNFIGMVIQVFSVIVYQDSHSSDPAREEFAKFIREKASTGGFPAIQKQVQDGTDDSLFAFFHYAYSPKELIDWGRTRKRYVYVGENWGIAVILGIVFGLVVALGAEYAKLFPEHHENRELLFVLFIIFIVLTLSGLVQLKKHNRKAVDAMDAAVMATLLKKFPGSSSSKWLGTLDD
jgi:hypothetical protein